jgi:hypothetical protein
MFKACSARILQRGNPPKIWRRRAEPPIGDLFKKGWNLCKLLSGDSNPIITTFHAQKTNKSQGIVIGTA